MAFHLQKKRIADFQVFNIEGPLNTHACFELKPYLQDTIQNESYSICFNLESVNEIDANGFKFLTNIQKNLIKSNRSLVCYGANSKILESINSYNVRAVFTNYSDKFEFEETFHTRKNEFKQKYFHLATGNGPIRRISLSCPICSTKEGTGYLCDEAIHENIWEKNEITPQRRLMGNRENEIDFELYEVAVCHTCFFSTVRLDYFNINIPEGTIPSVLTQDEKDAVQKNISTRMKILAESQKAAAKSIFNAPRESQAGCLSWQLYDQTLRDMAKSRTFLDSPEIARANLLGGKFASSESERKKHLTTAQVWLTEIMEKPEGRTTRELIASFVFLLSVNLALNKVKETKKIYEKYHQQYKDALPYAFWLKRAEQLGKPSEK